MDFVDLDRHFIPLTNDNDVVVDWGQHWGRKYGGWLSWSDLLKRRRVVLLAEALSGKTKELEHRRHVLKGQKIPAFFVRIEDLADRGFTAALDEGDIELFDRWKDAGSGDAWFFLDSVDEARLNGKRFSNALQAFRRELGRANLNRSFVIVTCRASDWKGKSDRDELRNGLPFEEAAQTGSEPVHPDEVLLAPIFNEKNDRKSRSREEPKFRPSDLLVVQLAPLNPEQQGRMAAAAGLDSKAFLRAIDLSGVGTMAERPGDLLDLIGYWSEHKAFGSLTEMTEDGVRRKLREEDIYRPNAGVLSADRARRGAEQIAAALVLAKTFSIKAPGQEPDPALSQGAVDPMTVLDDWDQTSIGALLRTGLFAPSTYGRLKFHHRATQEYLAACWLRQLLSHNCPLRDVHQLLFAESYGVSTVVPSLLPTTAWLSQWVPSVRDELIKREPSALIVHGDSRSLSVKTREMLLDSYAELDAKGESNADSIDYRAAWMFADPALAKAIRRAWNRNPRTHFRLHLLQFIEEGRIFDCSNLAKQAALDQSQDQYIRLLGARALVACGDITTLKALSKHVQAEPDRLSARLAPQLADLLYPNYLNTNALLQLIDRSVPAARFSSEGFASHLATLHEQATSREAQKKFVAGIAALAFPVTATDDALGNPDRKHAELTNGIAELANAELAACHFGEVDEETLRLLMAVERADMVAANSDEIESLSVRVRRDKALNRQLMWADAATSRNGIPKQAPPVHIVQVGPYSRCRLWGIDSTDIDWLADDAKNMPSEHQRRVAFSGLFVVLQGSSELHANSSIDELALSDSVLQADLDQYRAPRQPDEWDVRHQAHVERARRESDAAKQSWLDFRDKLKCEPSLLDMPEALTSWSVGLYRLYHLTQWVKQRAAQDGGEGMSSWPLLQMAFTAEVADHYQNGMRQAWRLIKPERPKVTGDNIYTTKHISQLAIDALELESLDPVWPTGLSEADVELAIRHITMAGSIKDAWVDRLIATKPIVLPEIALAVRYEFKHGHRFNDILLQTAYHETSARSTVTIEVFRLLKANEPIEKAVLQYCVRIIERGLDLLPHDEVLTLTKRRLARHLGERHDERAFEYLSILAKLNGEGVATFVLPLLVRDTTESDDDFVVRVQHWIGILFSTYGSPGVAMAALQTMTVSSLVQFLRLAYRHVPIRGDGRPRSDSRMTRRDAAEGARNSLLNALLMRRGADAYAALLTLAGEPEFVESEVRFKELAHGKAQSDADIVPWTASEVAAFAREHAAPIKTGNDLARVTIAVLEDIADAFKNADASSRAVVARAEDEEEVQTWLTERLNERRRGRYHAHREAQVADRNEPDIVVSSTSADVQVAIEVKNANMGWTVQQLERAITNQLARDYLRTENRRHGILVVSLHRPRTWRVAGQVWNFDQLMTHLQAFAAEVKSSRTGFVVVAAIAINACTSHSKHRLLAKPESRSPPKAPQKNHRPRPRGESGTI